MIRIVIVDDHLLFADGLAAGLASLPDMNVVATFNDGSAFLHARSGLEFDVLLLDLEMPGQTGTDVLRAIRNEYITLIVSMHTSESELDKAISLGARGVLSKATPLTDMAAAIRAAWAGHDLNLNATTLRDVLDQHQEAGLDPGAASLTPREREVLALMARGITATDELADRLYISQKTVKNHLANIFDKLAISDRAQAVVEAIRLGLAKE